MGKMHAEGVTLIELLVALAVAAILLTLGIPAFADFLAGSRMSAASNDLVTDLLLARSEAVKRQAPVTLCASDDPAAAAPACSAAATPAAGWLVFADANGNARVDAGETVVSSHGPLPADLGTHSAWNNGGDGPPYYAAFSGTGFRVDLPAAGSRSLTDLQLCDARGNRNTGGGIAAGRWIQLAPTGRPQVHGRVAELQGADNPLGGC